MARPMVAHYFCCTVSRMIQWASTRSLTVDSPTYKAQEAALRAARTIDVPTIFVCGDADACTLPAVSRNVERFYKAGYERIEIPGVGHFPHREQPITVADLILRFAG
jgi:pimeloyl-ACP methyl ester carboxylesterase